ncbi:MAG: hypothetical protein NC203_08640 [Firmicutes bacterium]|nr:hypothetical protein [[Eubacterium] siraeum]MCM1488419.1 hypothetical protein [Bacillota bacterium]
MAANIKKFLRKIFPGALAAALALLTPLRVFAEGNVLENYQDLDWQGDKLFLDGYSNTLYFEGNGGKETQTASLSVDVDPQSTGFFFYADGGNGRGNDIGCLTLTLYDGEGKPLFASSTGNVKGFGNYARFSIGAEDEYYPMPEKAERLVIDFTALRQDEGQRVNAYFGNFSLFFSDTKPLSLPEKKDVMDCRAGLSKVEIGVTPADHWFWVAVIFLVAIAFLIIAKWRNKYSVNGVMKSTGKRIGK